MLLLTLYGVLALSFMMVMYALERRGRRFILAFALGCLLSSVYGFISGAWPFGVVEAIWCVRMASSWSLYTKIYSKSNNYHFFLSTEIAGGRFLIAGLA